ncbi:MAG: cell division protein FtsK [Planctomycetaceae bacterium]|nr:cell division protein FtsK [Planctomycetaceae bacterium]
MPNPDTQKPQPQPTDDHSYYNRDLLREQITTLREEATRRSKHEKKIELRFKEETTQLNTESESKIKSIQERCQAQVNSLNADFEKDKKRLEGQVAAQQEALDIQRKEREAQILREWEDVEKEKTDDLEFESLSAGESLAQQKEDTERKTSRLIESLAQTIEQVDGDLKKLQEKLTKWRVDSTSSLLQDEQRDALDEEPTENPVPAETIISPLPEGKELLEHFKTLIGEIQNDAKAIKDLPSAYWAFADGITALIFIIPCILSLLVAAGVAIPLSMVDSELPIVLVAAAVATTTLVVTLGGILLWRSGKKKQARGQLQKMVINFSQKRQRLTTCHKGCIVVIENKLKRDQEKLEKRHERDMEKKHGGRAAGSASAVSKKDAAVANLQEKYQAGCRTIEEKRMRGLAVLDETYPPKIQAVETKGREKIGAVQTESGEKHKSLEDTKDSQWQKMADRWKSTTEHAEHIFSEANLIDAKAFPAWSDLSDGTAPLPETTPPGIRFGHLNLSMSSIEGGVSQHALLNSFGPKKWEQPAFIPCPTQAALLIKSPPEEKENASNLLQAVMLRIASGLPPGQSRFTIIDPLGLGKQFAGFMHLADHDELLVSSRIWTEPGQIDKQLELITEQMEMVIQKYLRNEYRTIGDYNAEAEVPEPYRFVVVANFPANFTETAARRLASIASSGARCGVFPIVSVDTSQTLPSGFTLNDIESNTTNITLQDGTFTWVDPEFSKWPLSPEISPDDKIFTKIINRVGQAAVAAKRVEVPFDRVAPPEEKWWTGDTAKEINVPLGPAGAKKTQSMRLGKGTSQHVLIAGKTGSGKSTMMHALITNLALNYSPNEIQFYLIDFKKGVEFKLYDHYKLPHARVIAIESEREFGLSVLEQLDRELKRRGDLFRDLSVQDLAGYRASGHPEAMPRVMLIIDEFQELFVEDDKLAQDCSLVLDRLVRQGRAFGMHVLLGSQTLGGSYSLPRATMGQMAVRVALQCNEADSSLILSEDNTAARLLTRPGEAIYNDANGMVEGNHPFQVVWLGEERREKYLGKLRKLADSRTDIPELPRLVFDGNDAADPDANLLLRELIDSGTIDGKPPIAPMAWLGDAIAIKDPTVAAFRRQGGTNLLIVGQREDLATSILSMATVSLAAGSDPYPGGAVGKASRFVLFEPAIAEEHPETMLSRLTEHLPHEIEVVSRLGVVDAFSDLAAEVQRRLDEQILDAESVFVVIRDLARFREIRRNENDFGFSMSGEQEATPAQQLVTILRDGPTVGIHAVIWCDSLTNLQRTFERGTLKEFELRVLFQMSGTDSSQLVENPAAGRLGEQRALFVQEETGTLEKFRPYQFPSDTWLTDLASRLRSRPQGTPTERPKPQLQPHTKPQTNENDKFSLEHGFGDDEFNFTKMLDDVPEKNSDSGASQPPQSDDT